MAAIADIQGMTKKITTAEHIADPEYAILAAIGGETLFDGRDEPARHRRGRAVSAQSISRANKISGG